MDILAVEWVYGLHAISTDELGLEVRDASCV